MHPTAALATLGTLSCLFAAACRAPGVDPSLIRSAVARNAVLLEPQDAPGWLAQELGAHRVLLLGETHYVHEHHQLLGALLAELAVDRRVQVLQESVHAFGWVANDYVLGRRDTLPDRVRDFDGVWLDRLRAFNEGRAEEEKIVCVNVDMNHSVTDFVSSLRLLQSALGPLPAFASLLRVDPRTAEYTHELEVIQSHLAARSDECRREWGAEWYARIVAMVDVERRSDSIRRAFDHDRRERIMIEQSRQSIAGWSGVSVINCGMNHAQKRERIYDFGLLLGTVLHEELTGVFSIAFVPAKGRIKKRFSDPETHPVDVCETTPDDDLIHILADAAGERIGYLPLGNAAFGGPMSVHLAFESRWIAPAEAFDAIVTYPDVSVLPRLR